jgi:MFS family permease
VNPRVGFGALLGAEVVSTLGNRISMVAIPWLVLVTTHDPGLMGLAAAAELVPYLLAGVFAAPVADRLGLRAVSVACDVGSAVAMALIAGSDAGFPVLAGLIAVAGTLRGVGDRAKHVLLRPVAEAAGLGMARVAAAYEALARGAMVVGAPLGGLLILWFGARGAVWFDAVSFALCGATVAALVRAVVPASEPEPYLGALRSGIRFLLSDHLLSPMLLMIFVVNVFAQAGNAVLVPLWVAESLGSPAALGVIFGSFAAGAVVGGVVFTALAPRLPRYPTFVVGLAVSCAPPLLILLTRDLTLVLAVTFAAGVAAATSNPILGTLQYERVPAGLQNRVFGLATAICYAGFPVGGVLGGLAVAVLGLTPALAVSGLLCLLLTVAPLFWYLVSPVAAGRVPSR